MRELTLKVHARGATPHNYKIVAQLPTAFIFIPSIPAGWHWPFLQQQKNFFTRNPTEEGRASLLSGVAFHILVDAAEIVHGETLMSQQRQSLIPYSSHTPLESLQLLFV